MKEDGGRGVSRKFNEGIVLGAQKTGGTKSSDSVKLSEPAEIAESPGMVGRGGRGYWRRTMR
jgi:hypothetical protein